MLLLIRLLKRLIHRNLSDSVEVKHHDYQISHQYKHKHLGIAARIEVECIPSAV